MYFNTLGTQLSQQNKELNSIAFWRSASDIKAYCDAILKFFGHEDIKLEISFSRDSASSGRNINSSKYFTIRLPEMPQIIEDENELLKQSFLRAVLLKHEVSHILFTDYIWQFKTAPQGGRQDIAKFINTIEDIKIERLFAATMKGNGRNFQEVRAIMHKNIVDKLVNDAPSMNGAAFYYQNRIMGFDFPINQVTALYEAVYQQFGDITLLPEEEYKVKMIELYDAMKALFEGSVEDSPSEEGEGKAGDGAEGEEGEEGESSQSAGQSAEGAEEGEQNGKKVQQNGPKQDKSEGDQKADSNSEGEEGKEDQKGKSDSQATKNPKGADGKKGGEGTVGESKEEESEAAKTLGDAADRITSMDDIMQEALNGAKAGISFSSLLEKKDLQLSSFSGAMEIDLKKASEWMNVKIPLREGIVSYKETLHIYNSVITDLVKFLKLKIQNRTLNRRIGFQEEGGLDQTNLKEVLIASNHGINSARAFYKQIEKIEPKSKIHVMIDISGSMDRTQLEICFINAVILYETCKRVGIDCGIYLFTSAPAAFNLSNAAKKKDISSEQVARSFLNLKPSQVHLGTWKGHVDLEHDFSAVLYVIKSVKEKSSPVIEKFLGALVKNPKSIGFLQGGTPEFESTIQVLKSFENTARNIFFIINDGCTSSSLDSMEGLQTSIIRSSVAHLREDAEVDDMINALEKQNLMFQQLTESHMELIVDQFLRQTNWLTRNTNDVETLTKRAQEEIAKQLELRRAACDQFAKDAHKLLGNKKGAKSSLEIGDFGFFLENTRRDYLRLHVEHNVNMTNDTDPIKRRFPLEIRNALNYIFDDIYDPTHVVYSSILEKMRKQGWRIYGIGIQSKSGRAYIGAKNFIYINSAKEVITSFSKKLREIF